MKIKNSLDIEDNISNKENYSDSSEFKIQKLNKITTRNLKNNLNDNYYAYDNEIKIGNNQKTLEEIEKGNINFYLFKNFNIILIK